MRSVVTYSSLTAPRTGRRMPATFVTFELRTPSRLRERTETIVAPRFRQGQSSRKAATQSLRSNGHEPHDSGTAGIRAHRGPDRLLCPGSSYGASDARGPCHAADHPTFRRRLPGALFRHRGRARRGDGPRADEGPRRAGADRKSVV